MDVAAWVVELRREFHRFAEPSGQEQRTSGRVKEILASLGIETRRVAGTGIVGVLRGGGGAGVSARTVALRADMDALQQNEKTGLSFASENRGIMHACGHDAHTAGLLGAARILASRRGQLCGNVVFLFQPAEELATGARAMIAEGALDGVDAAFGLHVFPQLPVGTVAIRPGPMLAGGDRFKVTFRGRGGHGAMPHLAIDAVTPACQALLALQGVVTKEFDASDPLVMTVGQIHGGTRFNVVADEAWFDGSVRYFRPDLRGQIGEKLRRVADATATAHRAQAEVEFIEMVPPTVNDPELTGLARLVALSDSTHAAVVEMKPVMGSEDFSFFQERVPGVFVGIGAGNDAKGISFPNHHPQFDIDEDCLALATAMYVGFAEAYLAK